LPRLALNHDIPDHYPHPHSSAGITGMRHCAQLGLLEQRIGGTVLSPLRERVSPEDTLGCYICPYCIYMEPQDNPLGDLEWINIQ
jgi:hypothetical protein